jgi:hypothetical protein
VCQQLGVPVKSGWKACSLALPPFAPSWESIEGILQDEKQILKEAMSVGCGLGGSNLEALAEKTSSNSEKLTGDIILV